MKYLLLEYPKCSTCRKAKKFLGDHGISYEDRHIVERNPTAGELGKWIAAICGAPSVLGGLGLLKGRSATCYPGMEETLEGAQVLTDPVVESENIITSRGAGTAVDFALALVARVASPEKAAEIARGIVYA